MVTPDLTQSTIDFRRGIPEGLEMFDAIEDPRSGNATRHPLASILSIALCGMDTCEDFVRFTKAREEWFRKWTHLPNGILCGDTLLRVVAAIDPAAFSEKHCARIVEEIGREPVEDFRLDFENGCGNRVHTEEDGHAAQGARQVAAGRAAKPCRRSSVSGSSRSTRICANGWSEPRPTRFQPPGGINPDEYRNPALPMDGAC